MIGQKSAADPSVSPSCRRRTRRRCGRRTCSCPGCGGTCGVGPPATAGRPGGRGWKVCRPRGPETQRNRRLTIGDRRHRRRAEQRDREAGEHGRRAQRHATRVRHLGGDVGGGLAGLEPASGRPARPARPHCRGRRCPPRRSSAPQGSRRRSGRPAPAPPTPGRKPTHRRTRQGPSFVCAAPRNRNGPRVRRG